MKFKFTVLFLSLTFSILSQEKIKTTFIDSLVLENKTVYEINEHNIYYSVNNVFYKKTKDKEFNYTNITLGNLTTVDLYNPLQTVLFYKDFNTVILLDNQLNENHKIEGNKLENIVAFSCIGLAIQNQIWFYDSLSQKIGLYNFKTDTYKFISTPLTSKITLHTTDYNYFYWIDEENICYTISIFGKIKTIGKLPVYDTIQILNEENYVIKKEKQLYLFKKKENKLFEISISKNSFDKFYYKNGILSIFTADKVINYKILLP
ncbi:hypothetical protein FIA58_018265 [Flavobacterium jejuense]|uniref:Uncharacterized protein n=1 Tax=Flavobacterium jejuense TaxID=1544455 RepID=A0ABX0J116_9FLAO|nr:hypothetical protein [Flavobacterium jejuense]NHN27630.1 hypothetical protein [Flavobacterium jejuense]